MRIAISAQGTDLDAPVDPRFGRAQYFVVIDDQTGQISYIDNRASANAGHGAGPNTASNIANNNVNILITGNGPGGNAARVLASMGIQVYVGASGSVRQAYEDDKAGKLMRQ